MAVEQSITFESRPKKISRARWILSLCILVPVISVWIFLLSGRWKTYELISASMSPTLEIGERVLMQPLPEGLDLTDSIVAFTSAENEGEILTKRVIAVGPNRVKLQGGDLFVGYSTEPVPGDKIYTEPSNSWEVKEGELFVVGDNRDNSHDSTEHGPILRSSVIGVITFRYWPLARIGRVD